MEIKTDLNINNKPPRKKKYVLASVLIFIGIMFLGKNLGYINTIAVKIIFSWPMLLIALGVWSIFQKKYLRSLIFILIGATFIISKFTDTNYNYFDTYWPLMLILLGVFLIFNKQNKRQHKRAFNGNKFNNNRLNKSNTSSYKSENGYLNVYNSFSGTRHIILEPVFKGADINNKFGGLFIDFTHTKLEAEETIINIECNFGGIEFKLPSNWYVVSEVKAFVGGIEDKRFPLIENIDTAHKLIIRGNISFSGLEIK